MLLVHSGLLIAGINIFVQAHGFRAFLVDAIWSILIVPWNVIARSSSCQPFSDADWIGQDLISTWIVLVPVPFALFCHDTIFDRSYVLTIHTSGPKKNVILGFQLVEQF